MSTDRRTIVRTADGHQHTLFISEFDIENPPPLGIILETTREELHYHLVQLREQDLLDLKAGRRVMRVTSSVLGHMHTVTMSLGDADAGVTEEGATAPVGDAVAG